MPIHHVKPQQENLHQRLEQTPWMFSAALYGFISCCLRSFLQ
jgi:hypothetical protein